MYYIRWVFLFYFIKSSFRVTPCSSRRSTWVLFLNSRIVYNNESWYNITFHLYVTSQDLQFYINGLYFLYKVSIFLLKAYRHGKSVSFCASYLINQKPTVSHCVLAYIVSSPPCCTGAYQIPLFRMCAPRRNSLPGKYRACPSRYYPPTYSLLFSQSCTTVIYMFSRL